VVYRGILNKKRVVSSIEFIYLNGDKKVISSRKYTKRNAPTTYKIGTKSILDFRAIEGENNTLKYIIFSLQKNTKYSDKSYIKNKEKINYLFINADEKINSIYYQYSNKHIFLKSKKIGVGQGGKNYKVYTKGIDKIEKIIGYIDGNICVVSLVFDYKSGKSIRVGNMKGSKFLDSTMQIIGYKHIQGYDILIKDGVFKDILFNIK
jgi:hypothetical protein